MSVSGIGGSGMQGNSVQNVLSPKTSADKFKEFMKKTPQEMMFEAFLKRNNLTEEEFGRLTPSEKESLLKKFEEELKQKAGL